ncbi:MAG: pectate lyase, partial [Lachnospiraceae bacterium]|nr:pectate lyase [Lachnospiraceae bacterium]
SAHVHSFTASGLDSDYFTISGNLSDSKGSVTYNGVEYTTCLKIESKTKVTFKTSKEATLVLVLDKSKAKIKVDGDTITADSNGIVTVSLSSGSHTIAKKDSVNCFYMVVTE